MTCHVKPCCDVILREDAGANQSSLWRCLIRRSWLRSALIRLVQYPPIVYLTVGAFLYFDQSAILFPAPKSVPRTTPADDHLPFEDLRIPVNAGGFVHAWWIPSAESRGKVLLVFHGNGYALEDMVGTELPSLHRIGANLLLVDYRGYGSSTRVRSSEVTVNRDADAAVDYLINRRRVPASTVFVLGRSIGSGPATHLAANITLGGLILESPFTSIDDAAAGPWYFRVYPIGLLLRTHFDNLARVSSVHSPLLVVSGTADTLTPAWMAKQLFEKAHQPKYLYLVRGAGHNDLPEVGGEALIRMLRGFLEPDR